MNADDERQRRAEIEAEAMIRLLFREVNDRIAEALGRLGPALFVCECARLGCAEAVELSFTEYEELRTHPNRFVVVPAHATSGRARVLGTNPRYAIVEVPGDASGTAGSEDASRGSGRR